MLAAADITGLLKLNAAHAHDGLGVAVAIRLQHIKGPDIIDAEYGRIGNQKVTLNLGLRLGSVVAVIVGQSISEIVNLGAFYIQARSQCMAAETCQMFGIPTA